ncbi:MAG: DUF445 domain-containing protein [Gammaproteobacteria bacterium]|nr:DUF445 domain-containing protein [Gammaproteobacteria bacterium]MCP5200145.1 DUF445 domain-containing protein [Gammaproteobacteria bacterium]
MNKSAATNLIALAITVGGYFLPVYRDLVFMTGLFALSGGITNWLAVHMLFEKVPGLYGSGVIPTRFEEFKAGIKQLIVQEFFTREHIERFFSQSGIDSTDGITARIDFDRVFEHLVDAISESSMGPMLNMVGGRKALEPLKEPVTEKLKGVVAELAAGGGDEDEAGGAFTAGLIAQVEHIIDQRLAELTPEKVKDIVEDMIRKHLGWLVVWGGVFGGLIGFVFALPQAL